MSSFDLLQVVLDIAGEEQRNLGPGTEGPIRTVAARLAVHPATLRRWIRTGIVPELARRELERMQEL